MFNQIVNVVCVIVFFTAILLLRQHIKNTDVFQKERDDVLTVLKKKYNLQVESLVVLQKERSKLKANYITLKEKMNGSVKALEHIKQKIVVKCKAKMKEDSINLQTELKKDTLKIFESYLLQKLKSDQRLLDVYKNINFDKIF